MGPIGSDVNGPQGLHLHSTLAFSTQGTPLGFLDAQCWSRDPDDFGKKARRHSVPIEEKESFKWLKSLRAVAAVQARCPGTTLVSVGDREADLYELFEEAMAHPKGPKLLVRAKHNRQLHDEQQRLWETIQSRPVDGIQILQVPRQGSRAARTAHMSVRYARVSLLAPTEFGRMPSTQGSKGRDHNPFVFTNWLCGGGIKGGTTHGLSDQWGYKPLDREHPTEVYDIHATILHLLGIDHTQLTVRHNGIDRRLTDVHGQVIEEIVA